MLFRGGTVVGDCVGLTSPRSSSKDGSVVFGVCVVFSRAELRTKRKLYILEEFLFPLNLNFSSPF